MIYGKSIYRILAFSRTDMINDFAGLAWLVADHAGALRGVYRRIPHLNVWGKVADTKLAV